MLIKDNTITSEYVNVYSLNNRKIGIPIFQRFYDWKDNEIIQFKEDLLKVIDDQSVQLYFLDFIYYEEDGKIKFADGQQRIVTLNNLIKVIKDVASEQSIQIEEIDLFDISYDVFANNKKYETHFYNYATAPFKKVYLNLYQFIKEELTPLECEVLEYRYGLFGKTEQTQRVIAKRLNISRSYVSRIEKNAILKLRSRFLST